MAEKITVKEVPLDEALKIDSQIDEFKGKTSKEWYAQRLDKNEHLIMHKNFARSFWAGFETSPFRAKFLAS